MPSTWICVAQGATKPAASHLGDGQVKEKRWLAGIGLPMVGGGGETKPAERTDVSDVKQRSGYT